MGVSIPEAVQAKLKATNFWHFVTLNPDGSPQTTPVWADTDGAHVIVNTAKGRRKERNVRRDPHVALSAIDLQNPYEWVEIRGRVVEFVDGKPADDSIDDLAEKYIGQRPYPYRQPGEERVILKIEPGVVVVSQD
jgi:PPOX class probable F420-dependent enzyme